MSDHTPFLTVFPGCTDLMSLAGGLEKAFITDVQIDLRERSMNVSARFSAMPSMVDLGSLCERLKQDYALDGVSIVPDYPKSVKASAAAMVPGSSASSATHGDVLYGRAIKQKPVPMNTLTMDSGRVTG